MSASSRTVMVVAGTRPEAIKLAPVVLELQASPAFEPQVALTAQHREMVDQVLSLFAIRPDHDLDINRPGQSLADVATRALARTVATAPGLYRRLFDRKVQAISR